jgi:hypothetical protein
MLRERLLDPRRFWSDFGVRSISREDPIYNNCEGTGPSNWQGPIWIVANHIHQMILIDNGMRAGIPDQAVRAATLCAYIDVPPFAQALQLPGRDSIYLFLLDRAGEILWRGQGAFDQAQCDELAATVEGLTSA